MKIRIQHRTTYHYHEPVTFGQHRIMVRPREGHDLHIESSVLEISPPAHTIRWMRDVNGNSIAKIDFQERGSKLSFYSEVLLNQYDVNPLDFVLDDSAVFYPFVYDADSLPELTIYMRFSIRATRCCCATGSPSSGSRATSSRRSRSCRTSTAISTTTFATCAATRWAYRPQPRR